MIKDNIQNQVNTALKAGDKERVNVLRFVLSQIQYKEINSGKKLTDEETVIALRQEVKKRNEAIEMFKKGARQDLVDQNKKEITIITEFLPSSMPEDELNKIIDDVIKKQSGPINTGKIIGTVVGLTKGKADASIIVQIVNKKLKEHAS